MPKKSDRMKKSKLSSTVLDYYYKYGQNRDLERFLRLKGQNSSKSSSDNSFKNSEGDLPKRNDRIVTSMEKLSLTEDKSNKSARESKAAQSAGDLSGSPKVKGTKPKEANIKIGKKLRDSVQGKSKSKSYNLNLESSIEINLPPSYSMPILPLPKDCEIAKQPTNKSLFESTETQTDVENVDSPPKHLKTITKDSTTEKPLPLISVTECAEVPPKIIDEPKSMTENIQESSPASSVASTKIRLEWDSMADIGYSKVIDFKSQSNSNLTTFEKNALTKFFAKRGLNFDDSLVIVASPNKQSPLQKRKFTRSAIEMRDAKKMQTQLKNTSPIDSKQLWENAIEKYRQKYGKAKRNVTAHLSANTSDCNPFTSLSMPTHHSTPVASSTCYEPKEAKLPTENLEGMPKIDREEKSCQTSDVSVEAIGIQVEQPPVCQASKAVQIADCETMESTQKDDGDEASVTSFEFVAPAAYNKRCQDANRSPVHDLSPPPQHKDEIPHRDDSKEGIACAPDAQVEDPEDKENMPPVEDKENVPPRHRTETVNLTAEDLMTPKQAIPKPNADASVLPNDLQKGVDLINALIDSRKIGSSDKKKLIRKIVKNLLKSKDPKDITQMILSFSDKSGAKTACERSSSASELEKSEESKEKDPPSKHTISGVSTLSSSASAVECKDSPKDLNKESQLEKTSEKEWLLPLTQSEIEKENIRKAEKSIQNNAEAKQGTTSVIDKVQLKIDNTKRKDTNTQEPLDDKKSNYFNWIDQEIEHLTNLKMFLENVKLSGSDVNKDAENINPVYAERDKNYLAIYENFHQSKKTNSESSSQAYASSACTDSCKSTSGQSGYPRKRDFGANGKRTHRPTYDSISSIVRSEAEVSQNESKNGEPKKNPGEVGLSEWNSHLNMQQIVKSRTKLKTPNSDESIESYAKACRAEFERKYVKSQNAQKKESHDREQPIYTKPYSSDSYSDVSRRSHSNANRVKPKSNAVMEVYRSVTVSDDGFLSPNSISIAVTGSTSNTTTHQYDSKISVGIQTTDTLTRMRPIQLKSSVRDEKQIRSIAEREQVKEKLVSVSTMRVNRLTMDKQLQARPSSLAYVITFKEPTDKRFDGNNSSKSSGKERGNKLYENRGKPNQGNRSSSSSSGKKAIGTRSSRQQPNSSKSTCSDSSPTTPIENFTLQEYLRIQRPDFYANAEERRKRLNDLNHLRHQRNEQREQLLATNVSMSGNTLKTNMKRLLPPPPLAQTRIFTSKDIVRQTRRKYQKLPEIRHRRQVENDKKIRRNQRMLATIFNKNLQRRVLTGKTDLSNSMTIY